MFLNTLNYINCKILELRNSSLSQTPLYGNALILNATILSAERFEEPLFTRGLLATY